MKIHQKQVGIGFNANKTICCYFKWRNILFYPIRRCSVIISYLFCCHICLSLLVWMQDFKKAVQSTIEKKTVNEHESRNRSKAIICFLFIYNMVYERSGINNVHVKCSQQKDSSPRTGRKKVQRQWYDPLPIETRKQTHLWCLTNEPASIWWLCIHFCHNFPAQNIHQTTYVPFSIFFFFHFCFSISYAHAPDALSFDSSVCSI